MGSHGQTLPGQIGFIGQRLLGQMGLIWQVSFRGGGLLEPSQLEHTHLLG